MKNSNSELTIYPATVKTVAAEPPIDYHVSSPDSNFGFAFNDSNFSDRVLRLEIVPDLPVTNSSGENCSTVADWARNRKRRREDLRKENDAYVVVDDQILNSSVPASEELVAYETLDGEPFDMIEESPLTDGEKAAQSSELPLKMDCSTVFRVRTIHISSPILASKSPFFYKLFSNGTRDYKLFSNGMRESEQRHVTLSINASEEVAFVDLLHFMYSNTLQTSTAAGILDVLMAADKFEVVSCMRYCSCMLMKFSITPESALLYLDLSSSVLMAEAVKPLTDLAKDCLAFKFKDINKCQEEMLILPLAGVEAVIASDGLQIASEDALYDFALKWARTHYPKLEERREVLGTRLCRFIRFPYMTCRKLRKVLTCNDLDSELATRWVMEALFFKSELPYRQRAMLADDASTNFHRYIERAYKYRPVKVIEFESPRQQCIVYLDLKKEECEQLFPTNRVYSQAFHLGGQGFFLSAHCNPDGQNNNQSCFGLFLGMQEKGSLSFAVDYEFAARQKATDEFATRYRGNYTFQGGKAVGYRNLFGISWKSFMAEDSPYFINGILHLRAELTTRH